MWLCDALLPLGYCSQGSTKLYRTSRLLWPNTIPLYEWMHHVLCTCSSVGGCLGFSPLGIIMDNSVENVCVQFLRGHVFIFLSWMFVYVLGGILGLNGNYKFSSQTVFHRVCTIWRRSCPYPGGCGFCASSPALVNVGPSNDSLPCGIQVIPLWFRFAFPC